MKKHIKTMVLLLVAAMSISFTYSPSKSNTTVTFKVFGTCEMCKERIEIALDVPGVKKAIWDVNTQMVTVTYNSKKLEVKQLYNLFAIAGHDTEIVKASEQAYADLPECCQYRSGAKCTDH
jgi:periplasmic mercuric ion binding protein